MICERPSAPTAQLPAAHAEVAVTAMQAGNNVLIELPLATTMEDPTAE
jgi:predicted dehydrogenase